MMEQSLLLQLSSPVLSENSTSRLRQEYQAYQSLFQAQPALIQQFLGVQATALADSVIQGLTQVRFTLPEKVVCLQTAGGGFETESLPEGSRGQFVGGWLARWSHPDLISALSQRFTELEGSTNAAVSAGAGLLRYAIATHMIYHVLPAGRSVIYASVDGDDIPNQPVESDSDQESAISGRMDDYTRGTQSDQERGELQVPYVEAARHFYLPQWVAFDRQGQMLVNSLGEAEAHIHSMEHYLSILHSAIMIAPYMIADEICQQKRYGILGQLVNQGRALAQYQVKEILRTIQRRVADHKLDRGLSLNLPYFNDQSIAMEEFRFEVIPAGRIMFVPAFVVLAVQQQGARVAQDTRFSRSTRRHLLTLLSKLEQAFLR